VSPGGEGHAGARGTKAVSPISELWQGTIGMGDQNSPLTCADAEIPSFCGSIDGV